MGLLRTRTELYALRSVRGAAREDAGVIKWKAWHRKPEYAGRVIRPAEDGREGV